MTHDHMILFPPKTASCAVFLPLNLRKELGFKDVSGLQCLWNLASEQESPFSEVNQNIADYFPQVHPTDHFLIPVMKDSSTAQRDTAHICKGSSIAAVLSTRRSAHAHACVQTTYFMSQQKMAIY